jgi:hypothetical protein
VDEFGEGEANLLNVLNMEFPNEVGGHVEEPKMCKIGNCIHEFEHCHSSFS